MKKTRKISILFIICLFLLAVFSPNLIGQKNTAQAYCLDSSYGNCFLGWGTVVTAFCGGRALLLGSDIPICLMTAAGGAGSGNDLGSVPGIGITCMDASMGMNPIFNFSICESIALTLVGIRCTNEHLIPCVCTGTNGGTMCAGDNTNLPNGLWDSNLAWMGVGTSVSNCTSRKCEYYTPAPYSCSGSIPAGSTMCAGDNTGLTANGAWHNVSACGVPKCEYTTPPPANSPIGFHEGISCANGTITTSGWTFDQDASATSLGVHFYEGSNFVGSCTTNQLRSDVNSAYGITGNHGFNCTLGGTFSAGSHTIYAYGINASGTGGSNALLATSPQTINCPTPPPDTCVWTQSTCHMPEDAGKTIPATCLRIPPSATCSCVAPTPSITCPTINNWIESNPK